MPAATLLLALVIRTYDFVGISARQLRTAEATSAAILQRAGITALWMHCDVARPRAADRSVGSACEEPPRAGDVLIRIAAAPRGRTGDTLGFAYVDTGRGGGLLATVYSDRIAAMAEGSRIDTGTLLGRAIAHEIGHLLLGTTEHEPQGLMRATWTPALLQRRNPTDWEFSRADREQLAGRMRLTPGGRDHPLAAIAAPAGVAP